MRNVLALVGAAVLTFAAVGWYLGWYQLHSSTDSAGHREVEIDFDTPKIKADINKGKKNLRQMLDNKDQAQNPRGNSSSEEQSEPHAPKKR